MKLSIKLKFQWFWINLNVVNQFQLRVVQHKFKENSVKRYSLVFSKTLFKNYKLTKWRCINSNKETKLNSLKLTFPTYIENWLPSAYVNGIWINQLIRFRKYLLLWDKLFWTGFQNFKWLINYCRFANFANFFILYEFIKWR